MSKNDNVAEILSITPEQMAVLMENAAIAGAKRALHDLGLHDEEAGKDVQELRNLLDSWRSTKKAAWSTTVKVLTTTFLTFLLGAIYFKMGGK